MSRDAVEDRFDVEVGTKDDLNALLICHQFIHSWILRPDWEWLNETNPGDLVSIYVASDRKRKEVVYRIGLQTIVDIFQTIGDEVVRSVHTERNAEGELVVTLVEAYDNLHIRG